MFEVVTTDNSRWHSNGIAGITCGFPTREAAEAHRDKVRAQQHHGGQGAFVRETSEAIRNR